MKVSTNEIQKPSDRLGDKRLWLAVMQTALVDIHGTSSGRVYEPKRETTERHLSRRDTALEWVASDEFCPGSFAWVCEALNMDAERIREGIARMKSSGLKGTRTQIKDRWRVQ